MFKTGADGILTDLRHRLFCTVCQMFFFQKLTLQNMKYFQILFDD